MLRQYVLVNAPLREGAKQAVHVVEALRAQGLVAVLLCAFLYGEKP